MVEELKKITVEKFSSKKKTYLVFACEGCGEK